MSLSQFSLNSANGEILKINLMSMTKKLDDVLMASCGRGIYANTLYNMHVRIVFSVSSQKPFGFCIQSIFYFF